MLCMLGQAVHAGPGCACWTMLRHAVQPCCASLAPAPLPTYQPSLPASPRLAPAPQVKAADAGLAARDKYISEAAGACLTCPLVWTLAAWFEAIRGLLQGPLLNWRARAKHSPLRPTRSHQG